jgi:D-alanyl-D-alanine carboxypeptidase
VTRTRPVRATPRPIRIRWPRVAGLLVAFVATGAMLGHQLLASSAATTTSLVQAPHAERRDALGVAGGAVPDGTTVFDDGVPGVARLDPALLGALRRAATDAGIRFAVDSGWRSKAYQAQLLRDAVAKYGSQAEAARWVATPDTSAHVSGDAVDLAPAAAAWLSRNGARYGLCRVYANEPWHFELRRDPCPPMYADPTTRG